MTGTLRLAKRQLGLAFFRSKYLLFIVSSSRIEKNNTCLKLQITQQPVCRADVELFSSEEIPDKEGMSIMNTARGSGT